MRQPGVEPGSAAWKAAMLTVTPLTLAEMPHSPCDSICKIVVYDAKYLEDTGVDPVTSHMLSERSTI